MTRRRQALAFAAGLILAGGWLGGCAWLSGFDGDDYAVAPAGGAGVGAGGGNVGGNGAGGSGAGSTGGAGATGASSSGGAGAGGGCMVDVNFQGARVFVLANPVPGHMGDMGAGGGKNGLVAADELCRAAATDAMLGGNDWVAYLSDADTDARDRIGGGGPWSLVDGVPVFPMVEMFPTQGSRPTQPINKDEDGCLVTNAEVWTGTKADGTKRAVHLRCDEWTAAAAVSEGTIGNTMFDDNSWGTWGDRNCSVLAHLYCFEKPSTEAM